MIFPHENELLEKLAALEHKQWTKWSQDLAKVEYLSEKRLQRWRCLWVEYDGLSDEFKDQDRVWATRVLQIVRQHMDDHQ